MDRSEYLLFAVTETLFDGDLDLAIRDFDSLEQYKKWIDLHLNHEDLQHDFDLANRAKQVYSAYMWDKQLDMDVDAFIQGCCDF